APRARSGRGRPDRSLQRGAYRIEERVWLVEGWVVAGIFDHVQGPAVAVGGRLGHPQRGREVVPSPDQRGRCRDLGELLGGYRDGRELPDQAAYRGLHTGNADQLDGIAGEGLPPLAQ